ncbi:hypothetical protein ABZT51_23125 [Streptomyces sp. NPDC005373]|uniref:hypothetical protein n=1 Tax=Streptomyces sp. NPDC005373 TaxID=3156879 RepID=UPI0033B78FE2
MLRVGRPRATASCSTSLATRKSLHAYGTPAHRITVVGLAALAATALFTTAACDSQPTSAPAPSAASTLGLAVMGTPNSFAPAQLNEGQPAYIWSALYDT